VTVATERDYYSILQVNRAASQAEIEAAFQRLSRLYDPAVSRKPRAEARWRHLNEAYETLSDRQRRGDYDRMLARQRPGAGPRGPEINLPPFLTSPYALAGAAVAVVVGFLVTLVLISVIGDGDEAAVTDLTPIPTVATSPGSPTPALPEQSPVEPPSLPPPVSGDPVTTPSGLQYIDIQPGTGATPTAGQTIVANYTGWLSETGALFDSSLSRTEPFAFVLGEGAVIKGWDEAFAIMQVGGKRRLIIPPALGYGEVGQGSIPPNATLIFDVDLIEVR
jgi:peptidylprolyl isomerase